MVSYGKGLYKNEPLKATAEVINTTVGTTAEKINENLEKKEFSIQSTTNK